MLLLLQILWLGLPAGISNLIPPIATVLLPKLAFPVDGYKSFRGKRIFGESKTIRGLIAGILFGELTFLLQQHFAAPTSAFNIIPYAQLPWYFGFLFGVGALGGDLLKSFLKRQVGIAPSTTWFPFDQIDWLVGTIAILLPFVMIPLPVVVVGLLLGILLHVLVKFVGYTLGIDKKPI